jgi:hypothetical protein
MTNLDILAHAAAERSGMRLIWVCRYQDGSTFNQFYEGKERSTEEIDRTKLYSISLLDARGRTVLIQRYSRGQFPIYRRRTVLRPGQNVVEIIHILGWRMFGEADKEIRHISFLYETDLRVECGDFSHEGDPRGVEEWKHPIQYIDCDNVCVQ